MFSRSFYEAVIGFTMYFKTLQQNPKKILPIRGGCCSRTEFYEIQDELGNKYSTNFSNYYHSTYMQLWYEYFGLKYPYKIMR